MDSNDKVLFTPGPLTTSCTVRRAMDRDLGSRDAEFIAVVARIREELVRLASGHPEWTAVPLQGSGTFALEAAVTTALPRGGTLLVLQNGAYGARIACIARTQGIECRVLVFDESRAVDPAQVSAALEADSSITHVALVHCETTTGIENPLHAVAEAVAAAGRRLIVDAMSSFGALEVDLSRTAADFLVSSSNKCIEGVPGLAFVLCRKEALAECERNARALSPRPLRPMAGLRRQRPVSLSSPPTQVVLALERALAELRDEGGPRGRLARYRSNQARIAAGMRAFGFEFYLDEAVQSPIITTFRMPDDPGFRFEDFYADLSRAGFLIYPGKLTGERCFRIGSVGRIGEVEIAGLLEAVGASLRSRGVAIQGAQ